MKFRLVIFSLLCCSSSLLSGCASTKDYLNDTFSVEKRACSKGDGKSCNLLGILYYFGSDSTKQNFSKSFQFHKKACGYNYAKSCNSTGLMYEIGEGVKRNYDHAKLYYAKGCQMKNVLACASVKRLNQ